MYRFQDLLISPLLQEPIRLKPVIIPVIFLFQKLMLQAPNLLASTCIGGGDFDIGWGIDVDANDNVWGSRIHSKWWSY